MQLRAGRLPGPGLGRADLPEAVAPMRVGHEGSRNDAFQAHELILRVFTHGLMLLAEIA